MRLFQRILRKSARTDTEISNLYYNLIDLLISVVTGKPSVARKVSQYAVAIKFIEEGDLRVVVVYVAITLPSWVRAKEIYAAYCDRNAARTLYFQRVTRLFKAGVTWH